jgi:hypothetical protein
MRDTRFYALRRIQCINRKIRDTMTPAATLKTRFRSGA